MQLDATKPVVDRLGFARWILAASCGSVVVTRYPRTKFEYLETPFVVDWRTERLHWIACETLDQCQVIVNMLLRGEKP